MADQTTQTSMPKSWGIGELEQNNDDTIPPTGNLSVGATPGMKMVGAQNFTFNQPTLD